MLAHPAYSIRLRTCVSCPHGSRFKAACKLDGVQFHDHAVTGNCPDSRYATALPVMPIPDDYTPTPASATAGGCGCKK